MSPTVIAPSTARQAIYAKVPKTASTAAAPAPNSASERLLAQTPPGSDRHAALVKAIGRAEMLAKVSLPPGP